MSYYEYSINQSDSVDSTMDIQKEKKLYLLSNLNIFKKLMNNTVIF